MKKYNLLKVLSIAFAIVVLLSWVIPASGYSNGAWSSVESTVPAGLYDLVLLPIITLASFAQYGILFLAIGGLYGVINRTGVYTGMVENIVKKFKGKEKKFLVATIIGFALLSSLTNLTPVLLVLVPFFVAILLSFGYNKLSAFAATIGSILVGQVGTTYGFTINGYLNYYLNLGMNDEILTKIILFAIVTFIFVMVVLKTATLKAPKKGEKIEIPLYEEVNKKKSKTPLVVVSIIALLIGLVGMYNWYNAFEVTLFQNIHEAITSFKIGDYPIIGNLLGSISEFGFLTNYDLIGILVISTLLIGWLYSLKMSEIIESYTDGVKQMLKPAFYAVISSVVFAFVYYNMSNGVFTNTIVHTFMGDKFNLPGMIGSAGVLGFFFNDFTTLVTNNISIFANYDTAQLPIVAIVLQSMYGLVMLIAPTSIYLMGTLSFMDLSFKDWAKYIWKFLLITLVVIIVITVIMVAFI